MFMIKKKVNLLSLGCLSLVISMFVVDNVSAIRPQPGSPQYNKQQASRLVNKFGLNYDNNIDRVVALVKAHGKEGAEQQLLQEKEEQLKKQLRQTQRQLSEVRQQQAEPVRAHRGRELEEERLREERYESERKHPLTTFQLYEPTRESDVWQRQQPEAKRSAREEEQRKELWEELWEEWKRKVEKMDLNEKEQQLFAVAVSGDVKRAQFLLQEKRIDINVKDSDGYTPLHHAIFNNDVNMVQLLVKYGAKQEKKVYEELLERLTEYLSQDMKSVLAKEIEKQKELKKEEVVPAQTPVAGPLERKSEVPASSVVARATVPTPVLKSSQALSDVGITTPAAVSQPSSSASAARQIEEATKRLFMVIRKNNVQGAEAAITEGADVNAVDGKGMTPLHYAVTRGGVEIVRLLLEKRADTTVKNNKGDTPLAAAKRLQGLLHISEQQLNVIQAIIKLLEEH